MYGLDVDVDAVEEESWAAVAVLWGLVGGGGQEHSFCRETR